MPIASENHSSENQIFDDSAIIKQLQKSVATLQSQLDSLVTAHDKTVSLLDKLDTRTKDFFGDYNKSLDKLDASDRDSTKIIDKLLERVKALEQQVAKLSKK